MNMLKFEEWLTAQEVREDKIGDFASFWGNQPPPKTFSKRKVDEHKEWVERICRVAQPGHIVAFNNAWQEFVLARGMEEG
ncbi:MAG: hypothetical protein H6636_12550 [Anaerolineales bacterium]|nr:hypothetical protein [Anaerolineales bacterium]